MSADGIPDFRWTGFYYPEILTAALARKAVDWPEHTETDPHDPVVQLLRLAALVAHGGSVRLDHVARELMLPTARLRSSLLALARLTGQSVAAPAAAEATVVADLASPLPGGGTLVRPRSIFGTLGGLAFELDDDDAIVTVGTSTYQLAVSEGGSESALSLPATPFSPSVAIGDALYIGQDVLFDSLRLTLSTAMADITLARWEYYDASRVMAPSAVAAVGSQVNARVSNVIGATRATGLQVVLRCVRTGASETCTVAWDGTYNYVLTAGALGQASISTSASDYEVIADWCELPDMVDGTVVTYTLRQSGDLTWTMPKDADRDWSAVEVAGVTAYWIRLRLLYVDTSPVSPVISAVAPLSDTAWQVAIPVRQGRTVSERVGTTDGSAAQAMELTSGPLLSLIDLKVGGLPWREVASMLEATAVDEAFVVREGVDGVWRVTFGDGVSGRIPGSSLPVDVRYRVGGGEDGNVGPGTIVRDRSGNRTLRNPTNPRAAEGWVEAEGSSAASLRNLRERLAAGARTGERAVTLADHEQLATAFETEDGSQVAVRALASEELYGPKTIGLYLVGPAGAIPSSADLAEVGEYFNGRLVGVQRIGGVGLANTVVTPVAYTRRAIDVTATIVVAEDYEETAEAEGLIALQRFVQPLARRWRTDADGNLVETTEFLWGWERQVSRALLQTILALGVNGLVSVTLTSPAADVSLAAGQLPVLGTVSLTVATP